MWHTEQQARMLPAPADVPATPHPSPENGPVAAETVQTPAASESALRAAVEAAGVKGKKKRRRLLARLAAALRGT